MSRQNGIKMACVFSLDSTFFLNLKFVFFTMLCPIMPHDAPLTPSQKVNRKWVCHAKMASNWCFFVPGIYICLKLKIFWNFFLFLFHTPLDHRVLQYTINVVATTKPEVGVQYQNSVKMEVFRPWTLLFLKKKNFHTPLDHRALQYTVNAVTTTKLEVGVERQNSVHTPLDHHVLRYTVNAIATTKPEVGVERQNGVKMEVFRPWTLHFFDIFYFFFHRA